MNLQIELFSKIEIGNSTIHDTHGLFSDALRESFNLTNISERNKIIKKLIGQQIELIRKGNRRKGSGSSTVRRYTEMVDTLIRIMWDSIELDANPKQKMISVVAVGGYGRMELCPKSDVDILILTSMGITPGEKENAEKVIQNLWDFGFQVGSSVRTVKQCREALTLDPKTWTSFLDERFLAGDYTRYKQFLQAIKKPVNHRKIEALIHAKLEEREQRLKKFGGLIQQLEPNLKEGVGGLRDVHTILWVARLKYGCMSLDDLVREGIITPQDLEDLYSAYGFLLRARSCLHFVSNKKSDIFAFHLQPEVASEFGFIEQNGQQPVEVFLQHFYRHTKDINRITEAFLSRWKFPQKEKKYGTVKGHPHFTSINGTLELKLRGGNPFKNKIDLMLEFFDVANKTGLAFGNFALHRMKQAVKMINDEGLEIQDFLFHFLDLCKRPKRVGRMLRFMHDVGLVELLIPDFSHVRCHAQHNIYHIYTTDEHTLTVVRQLAYLGHTTDPKLAFLKEVISKIENMNVLILACIFHDIAKGLPGDHSEVGARLIYRYMKKTGFFVKDCEQGAILVLHHLAMNEIAQRRNLEDPKTIFDFIDKIREPDTLMKLYVLTYCDTSSVHPDAWTNWKASLLESLYKRTMQVMTHKFHVKSSSKDLADKLIAAIEPKIPKEIIKNHLDQMPKYYLSYVDSDEVITHLEMVDNLKRKKFTLNLDAHETHLQLTVVAKDNPKLLISISGAIANLGFSILTANIYTRWDGIAIDNFRLNKSVPQFLDIKKAKRKLESDLRAYLTSEGDEFLKLENKIQKQKKEIHNQVFHVPVGINFSNIIAEDYSTIDVSCQDQIGLMYLVCKVLTDLELNIHVANLTTEAKVALDAFYVTDLSHKKIESQEKIKLIKNKLEDILILN